MLCVQGEGEEQDGDIIENKGTILLKLLSAATKLSSCDVRAHFL